MPRDNNETPIRAGLDITPHELVNAQILPSTQVVVLFTRESKLTIAPQETVIAWDTIEGLFLAILNMRLQMRGVNVGLQQLPLTPH